MLVAVSRFLGRRLLGRDVCLCAVADWHRWRARWLLDAAFFVLRGERGHCARLADWEARQGRERGAVDEWRRAGWL